ncbi:MAG: (Fe-S)-binding protein [Deltaproteobacteria bacterium]|nr:(Fe-S)-binding protein [Deltaproteobacteria bacterium]
MQDALPVKKPDFSRLSRIQVMELFACTRCGRCVSWCPVYEFDAGEDITPRAKLAAMAKILRAQNSLFLRWLSPDSLLGRLLIPRVSEEELRRAATFLYECSTCRQCHFVCPSGIDTVELYEALRRVLVEAGYGPMENHGNLLKSSQAYDNPWQRPRSHRDRWAKSAKKEGRINAVPPTLKPGASPAPPSEEKAP